MQIFKKMSFDSKFTVGLIYTGKIFAGVIDTSVIDTGGKFAAGVTTPVVYCRWYIRKDSQKN